MRLDRIDPDEVSLEARLRRCIISSDNSPDRLTFYRQPAEGGIIYRCCLAYGFSFEKRGEIFDYLRERYLQVNLAPSGWLEVFQDDRGLGEWLGEITRFFGRDYERFSNSEFVFQYHYAYSRCNALLGLARREDSDFSDGERDLLSWLLKVVDRWDRDKPGNLADGLSRAILDHDRYYPTLTSNRSLLAAGRAILLSFLVERLNFYPFEEL